jgi:hypothetical protein
VIAWPGEALASPSVLVIERSADGARVSVSVAELFPSFSSEIALDTVAVLTRLPVAPGSMVHVAV